MFSDVRANVLKNEGTVIRITVLNNRVYQTPEYGNLRATIPLYLVSISFLFSGLK